MRFEGQPACGGQQGNRIWTLSVPAEGKNRKIKIRYIRCELPGPGQQGMTVLRMFMSMKAHSPKPIAPGGEHVRIRSQAKVGTVNPLFHSLICQSVLFQWPAGYERILDTTRLEERAIAGEEECDHCGRSSPDVGTVLLHAAPEPYSQDADFMGIWLRTTSRSRINRQTRAAANCLCIGRRWSGWSRSARSGRQAGYLTTTMRTDLHDPFGMLLPCNLRPKKDGTKSPRSARAAVHCAWRCSAALPAATISIRKPAICASWWTISRQPFPESPVAGWDCRGSCAPCWPGGGSVQAPHLLSTEWFRRRVPGNARQLHREFLPVKQPAPIAVGADDRPKTCLGRMQEVLLAVAC